MKRIRRLRSAPPGLAEYRALESETASWNEFRDHQDGRAHRQLLDTLGTLQHGLCGYCEIELIAEDRQVEHVVPKSDPADGLRLAFEASNLIACCKGGTKNLGRNGDRRADPVGQNLSCGQAKGASRDPAFLDPRDLPELPSLLRVRASGRLEADRKSCAVAGFDPERVERTIEILGLNVERLCGARKQHWLALDSRWQSHQDEPEVMTAGAREELLPGDSLSRFFTTARSYFGKAAENVLAEAPEDWV